MSRLSEEYGAETVSALLSAMLLVREQVADGVRPDQAICVRIWALDTFGGVRGLEAKTLLRHLYSVWPKFSGSRTYPVPGSGEDDELVVEYYRDSVGFVPGPVDSGYLAEMYFDAVDGGELHDGDFWAGRYGELRRELMQFVIDELQKGATA